MIGPVSANCKQACKDEGLICLESELESHNGEVDSSEEVVKLIKKLGGKLTKTTCNTCCGSGANKPRFAPNNPNCYTSAAQNKTYDCGAMPDSVNMEIKRARICYCVKGKFLITSQAK